MAIYAIDFDNTLAITRFPEIVAPNKKMVAFAEQALSQGQTNAVNSSSQTQMIGQYSSNSNNSNN